MQAHNVAISKGTAYWSQRTATAVYEYGMIGLIFMMPEGSLDHVVRSMDDWRVALMTGIVDWTQENESPFLPFFAEYDAVNQYRDLPSLASILDAEEGDLPHIYLLHP